MALIRLNETSAVLGLLIFMQIGIISWGGGGGGGGGFRACGTINILKYVNNFSSTYHSNFELSSK